MYTLILTIIAIAVIDSINPNALSVQIYLLSTAKPVTRSLAFIAGDFLATWIAGLLIILGIAPIIAQIFNSFNNIIVLLQFILGIVLVLLGFYFQKFYKQSKTAKHPRSLKPINTFILGVAIAFAEAPTALPYLGAIEQIVRANLSIYQTVGILTIYNFVFVLPLIILFLIYLRFQQRAITRLNSIQHLINQWFAKIMQVFLIVFGLILIFDSVAYFFNDILILNNLIYYKPCNLKLNLTI
jgi:cytochrome c biogenesis protein CcdA